MTDAANRSDLRSAVQALWDGYGQMPPSGQDLDRAADLFRQTLAAGCRIPRTTDKTIQPLYGPRRDIETGIQRNGR